jgi:hypothetical protein
MSFAIAAAQKAWLIQRLNAGWSSPVARQAHNLKVVGSNPTPATNLQPNLQPMAPFVA